MLEQGKSSAYKMFDYYGWKIKDVEQSNIIKEGIKRNSTLKTKFVIEADEDEYFIFEFG